jgi:hypothetical protein
MRGRADWSAVSDREQVLAGGFVAAAVRVGDTVRRQAGPDPGFVRALLEHFERCGWTGAPRYLGRDEQGREILTFIEGAVAWEKPQPTGVRHEGCLAAAARTVRQFHDLTAGCDLANGHEVVCHNDLAPRNTVYRDLDAGLLPVAFIDWDIATPGPRRHDVAHMCWQYVGLGPEVADAAEAARLVRLMADAYGLDDRDQLLDTILWWQDRCWRGIEAGAASGVPAMVRLRDAGAADEVRAAYDWTARHADVLAAALS